MPRRFKLRRADPCAVCGRGSAVEEVAVGDALCVRCDPGWSEPIRPAAVVELPAGAVDVAYARAGGMFWLSRKRLSRS